MRGLMIKGLLWGRKVAENNVYKVSCGWNIDAVKILNGKLFPKDIRAFCQLIQKLVFIDLYLLLVWKISLVINRDCMRLNFPLKVNWNQMILTVFFLSFPSVWTSSWVSSQWFSLCYPLWERFSTSLDIKSRIFVSKWTTCLYCFPCSKFSEPLCSYSCMCLVKPKMNYSLNSWANGCYDGKSSVDGASS